MASLIAPATLSMENAVVQTGIAILTNDYGKECRREKANNNLL